MTNFFFFRYLIAKKMGQGTANTPRKYFSSSEKKILEEGDKPPNKTFKIKKKLGGMKKFKKKREKKGGDLIKAPKKNLEERR